MSVRTVAVHISRKTLASRRMMSSCQWNDTRGLPKQKKTTIDSIRRQYKAAFFSLNSKSLAENCS